MVAGPAPTLGTVSRKLVARLLAVDRAIGAAAERSFTHGNRILAAMVQRLRGMSAARYRRWADDVDRLVMQSIKLTAGRILASGEAVVRLT